MRLANLQIDGWELDDGVQLHRAHPKTFWIPNVFKRHLLRPKQIVKLVFRIALRDDAGVETEEVERMWVIIERRLGLGQYEGLLDNDPYCTKGIKSGMKVFFEARHVIQIHAANA
ncbi:DUF2314 domain-containing protein [Ideonella dechloratans]|uniref:DUF2314 domain-containing protein n=1 Tax=Ideonella dechloratans TaxID=36863 RepID=A0A643FKB9_IDEDE|nr:DUF2314 domain-containing protein [Ideonella dechloratans]